MRETRLPSFAVLSPAVVVLVLLAREGVNLNRAGNLYAGADVAAASQREERAVAGWLEKNLPAGSTLMSHKPWLALRLRRGAPAAPRHAARRQGDLLRLLP